MGAAPTLNARAYRGGVRFHDGMLSFGCHSFVAAWQKPRKTRKARSDKPLTCGFEVVGRVGLEPTTLGLKVLCSTN